SCTPDICVQKAELLQSLKTVQARNKELERLISTSKMQACGLKKTSDSVKRPLKNMPDKGANKRNFPDLDDQVIFGLKTENVEQEGKKEKSSQTDNKSKISETNKNVNLSNEKEVTGNIKQKEKTQKPAVFVNVNRKPEIQALREALPIYVVKPHKFLNFSYEAGFTQTGKKIAITEPRRFAAMSMSARVGEELNMPEKVESHQYRVQVHFNLRTPEDYAESAF
ncbi:hypothetical protein CEXT_137282, partial [Caerostris extrusa]